jgi:hypothetical protein
MHHLKFDESGPCASIKDIGFMSGRTRAAFGDAEALCIQENLKLFNVRTHRTNAEIAIEAEFNRSSLLIYSAVTIGSTGGRTGGDAGSEEACPEPPADEGCLFFSD